MYISPEIVVGFHGCDQAIANKGCRVGSFFCPHSHFVGTKRRAHPTLLNSSDTLRQRKNQ